MIIKRLNLALALVAQWVVCGPALFVSRHFFEAAHDDLVRRFTGSFFPEQFVLLQFPRTCHWAFLIGCLAVSAVLVMAHLRIQDQSKRHAIHLAIVIVWSIVSVAVMAYGTLPFFYMGEVVL